ncbi:MAG: glycosyltransferase [Spirochaetales bacterium]
MKILQVITLSETGGAQSVVIELSNESVKMGHELFVAAKSGGPMWDLLHEDIKKIECDDFAREINPLKDIKSFFFLKKTIKTLKPDIIHLHTSKIGALGRLAAFPFFSKKVVYTVHGFDQILKAHRIFLPVEKLLKNCCAKIVAASRYDEKNLLLHKIRNIEVACNAVGDKKDIPCDDATAEKICLCANGKKIIMSIARTAKPKRFDLFIKIAQKLPQYCFIWIGNDKPAENLPQNMHCLGEIPNAGCYNTYADLFILLSNHEGLPVSIIEALSCGVPVLASDVGGVSEILDNSCGYALENDENLFAKKIEEIFSDEAMFQNLKQGARKKYEAMFTIDKMVQAYAHIYTEIMKKNLSCN